MISSLGFWAGTSPHTGFLGSELVNFAVRAIVGRANASIKHVIRIGNCVLRRRF